MLSRSSWSTPRQPNRRRGAATVEFAVVFPLVLLPVLLGIIEFGRAMSCIELLNNGARHGCRQAALPGMSTRDILKAVKDELDSVGFRGGKEELVVKNADDPSDIPSGGGQNIVVSASVYVNGEVMDARKAVPGDSITLTLKVPAEDITLLPSGVFLRNAHLQTKVVMRRE